MIRQITNILFLSNQIKNILTQVTNNSLDRIVDITSLSTNTKNCVGVDHDIEYRRLLDYMNPPRADLASNEGIKYIINQFSQVKLYSCNGFISPIWTKIYRGTENFQANNR